VFLAATFTRAKIEWTAAGQRKFQHHASSITRTGLLPAFLETCAVKYPAVSAEFTAEAATDMLLLIREYFPGEFQAPAYSPATPDTFAWKYGHELIHPRATQQMEPWLSMQQCVEDRAAVKPSETTSACFETPHRVRRGAAPGLFCRAT